VWVLFGPTNPGDGPFPGADKVVHVVLFALLAGTARWFLGGTRAVLLLLAVYAAGSEVVQGVVLAGRSGDPLDVVADLVGVALGWVAARRLRD
jgi:VanZ family protein